ncbi:MAG: Maf family protein [Candidatus Tantalella remota]|nr:Maf family protein [Candidatus Tantalella remota]
MKSIILASASERRSRILIECGIKHEVRVSNADENAGGDKSVYNIVVENASKKADVIVKDCKKSIVIGADTMVLHGETIIGKPADENEARGMLKEFSGTGIEVYTGLCVVDADGKRKVCGYDKSSLVVAALSEKDVDKYFKLLGPYDKAGGFSIEGVGSLIFDNIRGSYFNILGLPMMKLAELFHELGEDIAGYIQK